MDTTMKWDRRSNSWRRSLPPSRRTKQSCSCILIRREHAKRLTTCSHPRQQVTPANSSMQDSSTPASYFVLVPEPAEDELPVPLPFLAIRKLDRWRRVNLRYV